MKKVRAEDGVDCRGRGRLFGNTIFTALNAHVNGMTFTDFMSRGT